MPVLSVDPITLAAASDAVREQARHHPYPGEFCPAAIAAVQRLCREHPRATTDQVLSVIRRELGPERVTVHTLSVTDPTIGLNEGADLPLEEVLGILAVADEMGWCYDFMDGHNLAVYSGGHHYNFKVIRP